MGSTKHFQSLFCEIRETDLPAQISFLDHGFLKGLFSVPYWGCKQSKYIWLCVFVIVYILERDRLFSFNCEFFLPWLKRFSYQQMTIWIWGISLTWFQEFILLGVITRLSLTHLVILSCAKNWNIMRWPG